jgi:hypothetical protein
MPENPASDKVDGEVFVTHIFADSETVLVRGITEPIYLTTDLGPDFKMIGTGRAKVKIERDSDGDLVMSEYKDIPDQAVTPFTTPTYTRQRAATVRLTQAIHEYLDANYPDGVPWQPQAQEDKEKQDINAYLDLWLAIHGDGGTPGMVFPDTGTGVFDWQVVREARRLIGFGTNDKIAKGARLLDSLLEGQAILPADMGDLVNREGGLMENVVYAAVNIAAERFNPRADDPGWAAEMHEDALRDASLAYTLAFLVRRNANA